MSTEITETAEEIQMERGHSWLSAYTCFILITRVGDGGYFAGWCPTLHSPGVTYFEDAGHPGPVTLPQGVAPPRF